MLDEIAALIARLDQLAAERDADPPAACADPLDPAADPPSAWRRRALDRIELQSAAAQRIYDLRRAAGNATAATRARPKTDREQCASCGLDVTRHANVVSRADGPVCIGCLQFDPEQRALLRTARTWPDDTLPGRLADLDEQTLRTLAGAVGGAGALRHTPLHHAVGRAVVQANRRRDATLRAAAKARAAARAARLPTPHRPDDAA